MTEEHQYPPGFLAITAGILLAMAANASALTLRDLGNIDLYAHPALGLAVAGAILGAAFAVAALSRQWRLVSLRGLAFAALGAALVAVTAGGDLPGQDGVPWTLHLGFVGMVAAAVCLHAAWFAAYCLLMLGSQWMLAAPSTSSALLLLVVAVGVAAIAFVKRQILLITSATHQANRQAAAASIDQARAAVAQTARDQWNSWVHDHLLVVFRLGSQRSPAARQLASELLSTGLSRPQTDQSDLRRSAEQVAAGQSIRLRWDVMNEVGAPPVPVRNAVEGAIGEAIRNAARHSGATTVSVSGELTLTGAEVTVTDAGSGFEPSVSDGNKLGIRTSIVAQMRAIGGWAEVLSEPGVGTQVRLGWQANQAPEPTLNVPLGWVVVAAAIMTLLAASRAWLSLGPSHATWVVAGFLLVILLTLVVSWWSSATWAALTVWLILATTLTMTAPAVADPESGNWLAVGSAALFVAVARVRRERLGLAFAAATAVSNVVVGSWLRPGLLTTGLGYWVQPAIYAGLAWLGLAQFERLLHRYREASERAIQLQQAIIETRAEWAENQRLLAGIPAQATPILEELAAGDEVPLGLANRCALVEAATRDYLTAPRLITQELTACLNAARASGAYVALSDGGPHTDTAELVAVRQALARLTGMVQRGSRLTVRWTLNDPRCFATATITGPRANPGRALATLKKVEILSDADALQVRFLKLDHAEDDTPLADQPAV